LGLDPPQRDERVHERGEEDADRVLDERVAAEPEHESRRVLAGGELHHHQQARHDEAREGDHPGRRGAEDVPRCVDARPGRRLHIARAVDLRHEHPEQDRRDEVQRGQRDQALPVLQSTCVGVHGR
jgi:hypothetical protein